MCRELSPRLLSVAPRSKGISATPILSFQFPVPQQNSSMPSDPLYTLLISLGLPTDRAFDLCERAALIQYEAGMSRRDAELIATGGISSVG